MNVWLHPTPMPRLDDDQREALVELAYGTAPNVDRPTLRRLEADALVVRPDSSFGGGGCRALLHGTWRLTRRGRRALDEGSP